MTNLWASDQSAAICKIQAKKRLKNVAVYIQCVSDKPTKNWEKEAERFMGKAAFCNTRLWYCREQLRAAEKELESIRDKKRALEQEEKELEAQCENLRNDELQIIQEEKQCIKSSGQARNMLASHCKNLPIK